jgi:cysteine-rich repeat protein
LRPPKPHRDQPPHRLIVAGRLSDPGRAPGNGPGPVRGLPSVGLLLAALLVSACGGPPSDDATIPHAGGNGGASGNPGLGGNDNPIFTSGGAAGDPGPGDCVGLACGADAGPSDCGNSELDPGEVCDDGNATPGDGCSGLCRQEPNFACDLPGEPCRSRYGER